MTTDQLHDLERIAKRLHVVLDAAIAEKRRRRFWPVRSPLPSPREESLRILRRVGERLHTDVLRLGAYVDAAEGR